MRTRFMLAVLVVFSVAGLAQASVIDATPGLLYHLDAAQGVTTDGSGNVTIWADQSGNGYDFSAPSAEKSPTYVSSVDAFNGNPVIHFNGSTEGASSSCPSPYGSQLIMAQATTPGTVFIVNRTTAENNNYGGIWGIWAYSASPDPGIRRGGVGSGTWRSATGGADDFPTSMYIDGVADNAAALGKVVAMTAYGDSGAFSQTALGEYFYWSGFAARPWGGDIAEVAVYSGQLGASDRAAIESYLIGKYAIPEPCSMYLFATGVIGLLAYAWKKRS